MKIEHWSYGLHGHDIDVTVCWRSRTIIDLEHLSSILSETLSNIDHKPLWETVGGGGILEDLIKYLCSNERLKIKDAEIDTISAKITNKLVKYYCSD